MKLTRIQLRRLITESIVTEKDLDNFIISEDVQKAEQILQKYKDYFIWGGHITGNHLLQGLLKSGLKMIGFGLESTAANINTVTGFLKAAFKLDSEGKISGAHKGGNAGIIFGVPSLNNVNSKSIFGLGEEIMDHYTQLSERQRHKIGYDASSVPSSMIFCTIDIENEACYINPMFLQNLNKVKSIIDNNETVNMHTLEPNEIIDTADTIQIDNTPSSTTPVQKTFNVDGVDIPDLPNPIFEMWKKIIK